MKTENPLKNTLKTILGPAIWLFSKHKDKESGKSSKCPTIKICKKCSAISVEEIENNAAENGYRIKYGCIGNCVGKCKTKPFMVKVDKQLVIADSEQKFFDTLKNKI